MAESSSFEKHLEAPRVTITMLDQLAGLAKYTEELEASLKENPDPKVQTMIERNKSFYRTRVGIDISQRDELMKLAEEKIAEEAKAPATMD